MASARHILVGNVVVGGGALPVVQSMTNTDTADTDATLAQIERLAEAGCEIVRCAIPSTETLDGFEQVAARSPLPVVADIHFDYRLAVEAAKRGAAKLRINPGNIGAAHLDAIIDAARTANIPLRIGVNAGSLEREIAAGNDALPVKLARSALAFVEHFENRDFYDLALSVKASNVPATIEAYRLIAAKTDYPLHIGITEAGTLQGGTVKSAVGLGILLAEGIGDTLRVSLTADPVEEVAVAYEILAALDIRRRNAAVVSCPTCGRCQVDLIAIANEVTARINDPASAVPAHLTIAVMGCVVNGPGEAREADYGIACGKGTGMLFAQGEPLRKVAEPDMVKELFAEIAVGTQKGHHGR
ncbi:MAG: flavodoxin-dependent (E)-4-hydroxy-3-methylbut-2-enyl-diphosphate synthase [Coriobacteriia bacterium]|nr:flavodoxin-dependent (E)-4-hydroxy-3-methylbut-2-enyl-diphosphate synthase [Coriobacteriia bacterium]